LLALWQTWDKGIIVVALPFLHFLDEHLVFINFFLIVAVAIRFKKKFQHFQSHVDLEEVK
jgi:hypothetical protein